VNQQGTNTDNKGIGSIDPVENGIVGTVPEGNKQILDTNVPSDAGWQIWIPPHKWKGYVTPLLASPEQALRVPSIQPSVP
jgi:hypothetical protein